MRSPMVRLPASLGSATGRRDLGRNSVSVRARDSGDEGRGSAFPSMEWDFGG